MTKSNAFALAAVLAVAAMSCAFAQSRPRLESPNVQPPRGETGIFGLGQTHFVFSVNYMDPNGDRPREAMADISGPVAGHLSFEDIDRGANFRAGLTLSGATAFSAAGQYSVVFRASDKDGPAQTEPLTFVVASTWFKLGKTVGIVLLLYLFCAWGIYYLFRNAGEPVSAEVSLIIWAFLSWLGIVWVWDFWGNSMAWIIGGALFVVFALLVIIIGAAKRARD